MTKKTAIQTDSGVLAVLIDRLFAVVLLVAGARNHRYLHLNFVKLLQN